MHLNAPMIVMDGAGIYDTDENTYLSTVSLAPASSQWLLNRLSDMGISYFIYTVHKNRNFIYHHGTMSQEEQIVYQRMKRSPYRQYLDDDAFRMEEIVYIKIVAREERAERIWRALKDALSSHGLRAVLRPQAGLPDGSSLYFYAMDANIPNAEKQVIRLAQSKTPQMAPSEVFLNSGYHSEHDAIHLLHTLSRAYEPLRLVYGLRQKLGKKRSHCE